jgi:hypothetical protein
MRARQSKARQMSDDRSDDRLADARHTLGQARAQLEVVLRENAHWRGLSRASQPANRAALERALASNPVFRAWELLGRAIGEMQALPASDAADGAGPLSALRPALTEAQVRHQRLDLRQVLERIRGDSPRDTAEVPVRAAAALDDEPGRAPAGRPALAPADIEIEEATVSFIIREPVRPAASAEDLQVPPPAATAADAPGAEPGDRDGTEVEVTIVRQPR